MNTAKDVHLTAQDLDDLGHIIAPSTGGHVNPQGYSADMLRGIIARHLTSVTSPEASDQ